MQNEKRAGSTPAV